MSRVVPEKIFLGLEGDPKVEIDVGNILEREQARTVTSWIVEKRKKGKGQGMVILSF